MDEHMKTHMLEMHMAMTGSQFFFQKPSAFHYGTYGLCNGGAWGLDWLEDRSRPMSQQCAFIPTK